jgi:hypothetical protein
MMRHPCCEQLAASNGTGATFPRKVTTVLRPVLSKWITYLCSCGKIETWATEIVDHWSQFYPMARKFRGAIPRSQNPNPNHVCSANIVSWTLLEILGVCIWWLAHGVSPVNPRLRPCSCITMVPLLRNPWF